MVLCSPGALCQQWILWTPQSIVAVGGSCLLVPCRFEIPAEFDADLKNCTPTGLWKKNQIWGNIVLSSAKTDAQNIIKGEMVGNLLNKNCTTIFNSFPAGYDDTYFFRLECAGTNRLKYTFSSGVNISHADTPPKPQLTPMGNITVGERVRLSCSAPALCPTLPPSLTWTSGLGGIVESQLQEGLDGLMTMTSTLTFTASLPHHGMMIKCSACYTLQPGATTKTTQGNLTFNVLGLYLCEAHNQKGSQRSKVMPLEFETGQCSMMAPYIICGVIVLLYVLTVTVDVYKYKSLSRRLKQQLQLSEKGDNTYTNLTIASISADYDQLQ
ncbi:unnamed protein product, partial [Coregonus sp. 'balchen']